MGSITTRRICIMALYLCSVTAILFTQTQTTEAAKSGRQLQYSRSSTRSTRTDIGNKRVLQESSSPSNTGPYGVSSPFSLPPYDSLPPFTNTPPFCVYPPFTAVPQPPTSPSGVPVPPTSPSGVPVPVYPTPPTLINPPTPPSPNPPDLIFPFPPPPDAGTAVPSPPNYEPTPNPNPIPTPYQPVLSPPYSYEPSPPGYVPSSPPPPDFVPSPTGFVPTPPLFQPPVVYPPPAVPPPPYTAPVTSLWCVAKASVPDPIIEEAMNYACGSGADCDQIQPNGSCFEPNTLFAHASYAFNSFWQRTKVAGGTCDFGGTAILVTVDPSYDGCHFIYY